MDTLMKGFEKLSLGEKQKIFEFISNSMANHAALTASQIRESRFSKGAKCPHCDSEKIKSNGKYRNHQRYKCKDCGRTFNDMTSSPMAGTHMPEKWSKHIRLIAEGATLHKVAKELEIHVSTAFYWRHKVLNALKAIEPDMLTGVVESDETFFLESNKGKNQVKGRKARKRGGVSQFRGISREQVCVVVAMDRSGHLVSSNAGKGRITAKQLDKAIGARISDNAILCTDSAKNYAYFSKMKGLQHHKVNARKKQYVINKLYHIQHVNSYHERVGTWITRRLRGVATKNLDSYLSWHRFMELNKSMDIVSMWNKLMNQLFSVAEATTVHSLRPLKVA